MTPRQEQELREEAERLKALDVDTQRLVVDMHRATANEPRATRADGLGSPPDPCQGQ